MATNDQQSERGDSPEMARADDEDEDDDEGFAYEEQENGSSVDIETEADDDECGLIDGRQPFQRADVDQRWSAPVCGGNEAVSLDQSWHYNERAYEDLCYVTFSSEVNIHPASRSVFLNSFSFMSLC